MGYGVLNLGNRLISRSTQFLSDFLFGDLHAQFAAPGFRQPRRSYAFKENKRVTPECLNIMTVPL